MKNKSKKISIILLAATLMLGLVMSIPLPAGAADGPFQVSENPEGAIYILNATAVPLKATFEYDALADLGTIDSVTPIKVRWYWSSTNSNTGRSNGFEESTIEYSRKIKHQTTLTPTTNTAGVRYYYAVLTYGKSVLDSEATGTQGSWTVVPAEAVTEPARIEVRAPQTDASEQEFRVKKVDGDGNPLAGAVIALVPDSDYSQDASVKSHEATSAADGFVTFSATDGYYILREKQAPSGYNATDEKYKISITPNGVFINLVTNLKEYETVTLVNKKIPTLNKEDHFAFMQGYPEGDFRPAKNMTRAEAVVMFSRLLAKNMDMTANYKNNYYPDVKSTAWYANQVGYMQELGVLADYSRDGRFRPDEPVTRAEFATLATHFDNLTLTDTNNFSDVPAAHWAVKYINSAAAKGWITGYPDETFRPEAFITRAEVVTLVGRMLDRTADSAYLAANKSSLPRTYWDVANSHWAYLAIMESSIGHDYTKDSTGEHWTKVYK
ncbi:MAG: S-layer homology domain-containing protein [Clostridiales bacterium]|jgi:hypothetical protein|nr:S-layer homology domain-containing protein [Clostridiales bacterium]